MSEIPVTDLYLFNHGMGFLIRSTETKFENNDIQKVIFKIKSSEINDVLKSLLLNIPDCTITDINFTTSIKEETNIDLPEKETLSSFIDDTKGINVICTLNDQKDVIQGRLISVQPEIPDQHLRKSLAILTESGLKMIELKKINKIQLQNKKLIDDLLKTIVNYTWDKDKERELLISYKPKAHIEFTDASVGYLIQMPIWKITYRLRLLPNEEVRLSGWVVVENETNDDWNQIVLKLISGNPISFVYDQDTLINLLRSDFTPAPPKASGPIIAQASLESETSAPHPAMEADEYNQIPRPVTAGRLYMKSMASSPAMFSGVPPPPAGAPMPVSKLASVTGMLRAKEEYYASEKENELMDDMVDAVQEIDKKIEAGSDYYVFSIKSKITIPSKEKSLIPLINEKIIGKKILYHKNRIQNPSPYQAIELTNNTEFPLESGPVMVFSDSYPSGQSILEKTAVGQSHILTYSLEDRVRLQYKFETLKYSEYTYSILPDQRLIIQRRFKYLELTIHIINFLKESRTLIVDYYPDEDDIDLISESIHKEFKVDKKGDFFRFGMNPEQHSISKYTIQFQKELTTEVVFGSLDKDFIVKIPPEKMNDKIKDKLLHLIEIQNNLRKLAQDFDRIQTRMNTILADEDRLQKNIMALSNRKEDERTKNNFILKLEEVFEEYLTLEKEKETLDSEIQSSQIKIDELISELKTN